MTADVSLTGPLGSSFEVVVGGVLGMAAGAQTVRWGIYEGGTSGGANWWADGGYIIPRPATVW